MKNPVFGLPLFSDHDTGKEAAERISPFTSRMRGKVLEALRINAEGLTAQEMEKETGMPGNSVRPRIIELSEAGMIETTGEYRLTEAKRRAKVWRLVIE